MEERTKLADAPQWYKNKFFSLAKYDETPASTIPSVSTIVEADLDLQMTCLIVAEFIH